MQDSLQAETLSQHQASHKPGSKNIVICCDGTGNEFGDANSNVVKLYTALEINNEQVAYYHPGVGTMGAPGARSWLERLWSQGKGLAFALGFKDNVFDAYRYLMDVYNTGDRVYLFGFSRGAYTVRALAGLIDGYGLLCRGNEGHIPYAWRLYTSQLRDPANRRRHSLDHEAASAAAFKETFSEKDFVIHFVGVWDTVSSVGWITTPLRLFNVARNRTVLRGRHAISIDERRCFYHDNIWGKPYDGQDILQVWFPGVHSDVGGSYPQKTSGLSNVTLEWMLDEARAAGVKLVDDRVNLVLGRPSTSRPVARNLFKTPESSKPHNSLNWQWWILEFFPHTYYDKDFGEEMTRIPLGARRELPEGALVHHTVKHRIDTDPDYRPANVVNGSLTLVTHGPAQADGTQLYRYEAKEAANKMLKSVKRWTGLTIFWTLSPIIVLCLVLLAFRWIPPVCLLLWHLGTQVAYWIAFGYAWLSHWI